MSSPPSTGRQEPDPTNPNPTNPPPKEPPATPDPTFPVGSGPIGEVDECEVDQLSSPAIYGHKVKTLLTGLPLTAKELDTLQSEPAQLSNLVDTWMATPEFDGVLTRFFPDRVPAKPARRRCPPDDASA